MLPQSSLTYRYFELDEVPYVQTTDEAGQHRIFNCSLHPPQLVDNFQRLPAWTEITESEFDLLQRAFLAARIIYLDSLREVAGQPATPPPAS